MSQTRNRRSDVEDLWNRTVRDPDGTTRAAPSAVDGKGLRWRARYVDENGREHAKGFPYQGVGAIVAQRRNQRPGDGFLHRPEAGKVTFSRFYKEWSQRQVWVSGTTHSMDLAANSVTFGSIAFADLRAPHIEAWVKRM